MYLLCSLNETIFNWGSRAYSSLTDVWICGIPNIAATGPYCKEQYKARVSQLSFLLYWFVQIMQSDSVSCSVLWHSCSLLLLWALCSFTGRRKEERRESLPCGNLCTDSEAEASRRPSFLKMVSLGKLKRESMSDKASQETEEESVEEEPVVKTREPLSGNNQGNIRCKNYTRMLKVRLVQGHSFKFENFTLPGQASAVLPPNPRQLSDEAERSPDPWVTGFNHHQTVKSGNDRTSSNPGSSR